MKKLIASSLVAGAVLGNMGLAAAAGQADYLRFDSEENKYTIETQTVAGTEVSYRAYKGIRYVENPVDTSLQVINVYIPTAYFEGGSINGFNSATAPIFFPNGVGGYMEAKPLEPALSGGVDGMASRMGLTNNSQLGEQGEVKAVPNALLLALSKGYVVASAGARGRETERFYEKMIEMPPGPNGEKIEPLRAMIIDYMGKAPAGIVDLKAAVRYLHYNDEFMPGDANKIISNGTSAGGAMSTLLGASGDAGGYESYLEQLRAAKASDSIFAVSAYCPIINLENADAAYEWNMQGIDGYTKMKMERVGGEIKRSREEKTLNEADKKASAELAGKFAKYVNKLQLQDEAGQKIRLGQGREGSLVDYLGIKLNASAQKELDAGQDLSAADELAIVDGKAVVDVEQHILNVGRSKGVPAFDAFDNSSGENSLFGNITTHSRHFTKYAYKNRSDKKAQLAEPELVRLMNPMLQLDDDSSKVAQHWRIRHGAADTDTSMAISALLALKLQNNGASVDYELPWGRGHSGDYDLEELFAWLDGVVR